MNRPSETTQKADRAALFNLSEMRLRGTWLVVGRVAWLAIVGMALALYIISIPSYFAYLHTVCIPGQCDLGYQLTAQDMRQLLPLPLSSNLYAVVFSKALTAAFIAASTMQLVRWRLSAQHCAMRWT
jgi:hypothetical protein